MGDPEMGCGTSSSAAANAPAQPSSSAEVAPSKAVPSEASASSAPPPKSVSADQQGALVPVPEQPAAEVKHDAAVTEAFNLIDKNGDKVLSRAEVIKTVRSNENIRKLLNLPEKMDDSGRAALETVFQGMDEDHSKSVDIDEFQRWFSRVKAGGPDAAPTKKAVDADGSQLAISDQADSTASPADGAPDSSI